MNSRASWSVDAIEPAVRERAEAAARRAGMSLDDWINSTLGNVSPLNSSAPNSGAAPGPQLANEQSHDVADIHQRLDSITQQIEQISRPALRNDTSREQGVARQLNDAISRLDARLSQISKTPASRPAQQQGRQQPADAVERSTAKLYTSSPPLSPASLDVAVAEITARQNELDSFSPRPATRSTPVAPPVVSPAPPSPEPDFSSLERHLIKITGQIEALQRPDHIEQSIAAFRDELAEIRNAITEAMPRHAIESIESEIRTLHSRIDESRNSVDGQVLAGIEHALGEIREVLRSLTPAEQLAGFDEAIRNLGAKLDLILRANNDPSTVQQFEGAIAALRGIVPNVASNDALARLSEDVHLLSSKVDQITSATNNNGDNFAILEQRIDALTAALESRERPVAAANTDNLESALRALAERFDRMEIGKDGASMLAHLEQRVSYLLERVEAFADRDRDLDLRRVEDGLNEVLRQLEKQQTAGSAPAESRHPADADDPGLLDMVKRELTDIRFSQNENNRNTQDSLEAVHGTLGHVVDRLAMIESDLRTVREAPAQLTATPPAPEAPAATLQPKPPELPKPELPNPAAAQAAFVAAPRDLHAEQGAPPIVPAMPVPPRAISEILRPHTSSSPPDLPPDYPLEPGTRPGARNATPAERIAASESAISEIPSAVREPMSSSSFIAAARRAAQAAAAAQPEKTDRVSAEGSAAREIGKVGSILLTAKVRPLLVSASVVVVVLGSFWTAMRWLDSNSARPTPALESSSEPPQAKASVDTKTPPDTKTPVDNGARSVAPAAAPDQVTPSMTSPTPLGKQSLNRIAPTGNDSDASAAPPEPPAASAASADNSDITGSIRTGGVGNKPGEANTPSGEHLPDSIGGAVLRNAAIKGDANAAYEIGIRFAEAKGVPANFEEAAKWYGRAAQAGVVPAIFRLGTLYEKGLGVKKDADTARRYYRQAADGGNAKAMHNLAVLEADGGGKGANYKIAAQWFRKAADRGVADSQFNLGVLYARGIGVEQNLAESFKWFSLAAAQGDADAVAKRDDVAKRLDTQSLAAAKLAIQTFTPEPQPQDAVNVPTPAGGWDGAPAQANGPNPARPAPIKRAAR